MAFASLSAKDCNGDFRGFEGREGANGFEGLGGSEYCGGFERCNEFGHSEGSGLRFAQSGPLLASSAPLVSASRLGKFVVASAPNSNLVAPVPAVYDFSNLGAVSPVVVFFGMRIPGLGHGAACACCLFLS